MLNAMTNSSTAIPAAVPDDPLLVEKLTKHANRRDITHAVTLILEQLAADPDAATALLPGFAIVKAPMTPAMRAAMSLPKANERRRAENQERKLKVRQAIEDQRASNPAITDYELAAALNRAGLHTYTKRPYTATLVRTLLNKEKRALAARSSS